jgi:Na+/H+ antiporter NhaD/arsenite permease-like protein
LQTLAIALFAITYLLLLLLPRYRPHIALVSAGIFVAVGIVPLNMVFGFIDWNVILMIAGTMGIVSLFIESRMPALLADLILEKTPTVRWAIVALSLFSGIISAFLNIRIPHLAASLNISLRSSEVKSVPS